MTTQMTPEECAIEKQCVEFVFGLTGGELSDKPLEYVAPPEEPKRTASETLSFTYHFDGVPEWATTDYPDVYNNHVEYFTVVQDCLWGLPPETITVAGKLYTRANDYRSSGETECPCVGCDEEPYPDKVCPLCERAVGEEHGHIYLGDGWCEVVYRHDGIEHMRTLCSSHNVNVWREARRTLVCSCGDYEVPAGRIDYRTRELDGATLPKCPSCGDWCEDQGASGQNAWWWETCAPGCLPDSDTMGPFDDEVTALECATEGLDD